MVCQINFIKINRAVQLLRYTCSFTTRMASYSTHSETSEELTSNAHRSHRKAIIGVCQMTSTSTKADNLQTMLDLIKNASSRGAEMVFFPEACDYIGETKHQTIEYSEPLDGNFIQQCKKAALRHKVWLSIGGFHQKGPETEVHKLLNTHVIIDSEGVLRATYEKAHLFDLDIAGKVHLLESDYVLPGQRIVPPIETPAGRIGLATCYDVRFPEMSLALAQQGAQVITYPSAFTQTTGLAHWECLLRARAVETQTYIVAAAQTGKHNAKRSSYGHAMVVDPWGAIIAQCSEGTGICIAQLDFDYLAKVRTDMPVWQHRRTDLYGRVETVSSNASTVSPDDSSSYQFGHISISSSQVFYRTPVSIAFVNIKPVLPGHMLVAPLRPALFMADLSPAEVTDLFMTAQKVSGVVKKHFGATSATFAVQDGPEAGQTINHVHVHILPRKRGDFADNDDIYDHLQNHDKGWTEETRLRSEQEMDEESEQLRQYFHPSFQSTSS